MFKIWDLVINHYRFGYITKIETDDIFTDVIVYFVKFFRYMDGGRVHASGWFDENEMVLAPLDIWEDDLLAMQHMALEMNDKAWFEELGLRLKNEREGVIR
ncbi:hypothetical protein [Neobacillus sp. 114]|uniref:hypothetical protein n=1 Tax=Neobacillus sp. 114 TaxID=3048535 RepID=UPI0024C29999|nr:hypothetical protein [Neobacillus sp. 114]